MTSDGTRDPFDLPDSSRAWILQANPKKYRIEASLVIEEEELWNLPQHHREVHTGDRAAIWLSGANSGIYAVGTVVTEPVTESDNATGMSYWKDKDEGRRRKPRVHVRYDRRFVARPLSKKFLVTDQAFKGNRILTQPLGTVFPLTPDEWNAVARWLKEQPPKS